jgi:hypothetical protein
VRYHRICPCKYCGRKPTVIVEPYEAEGPAIESFQPTARAWQITMECRRCRDSPNSSLYRDVGLPCGLFVLTDYECSDKNDAMRQTVVVWNRMQNTGDRAIDRQDMKQRRHCNHARKRNMRRWQENRMHRHQATAQNMV